MAEDEDEEAADADEGAVLSPEELDITDDRRVLEIDEGRYVISSGDRPPSPPPPDAELDLGKGTDSDAAEVAELTDEAVHEWLTEYVSGADSRYGFDVTAKFEGTVHHRELFSNDVVTTFESLVVWYAQHVGDDTPVEEALGILLTEANVPVWRPPDALDELVAEHGLTAEDTIDDLLDAVRAERGFHLPASASSRRRRR